MRMCLAFPLVAMVFLGCGASEQSRFYTLNEDRVSTHATAGRRASTTVALGAVKLPPALDRPQMARRLRDDEISYAEFDRWAGPLDEMVRRVLVADLDGRLPSGMILTDSASSGSTNLAIAIDVIRFDADATGRVQLDARWEVLTGAGRLVGPPHNASITDPGSGQDAAAIAATMSRALAQFAGEIGAGMGSVATARAR